MSEVANAPDQPAAPDKRRGRPSLLRKTSLRRRIMDRGAAAVVTGGGLAIIASILGILLFILVEVLPLTQDTQVGGSRSQQLDVDAWAALGDEHRTHAAVLTPQGDIVIAKLATNERVASQPLFDEQPSIIGGVAVAQDALLSVSTADGRIGAAKVDWKITFVGSQRQVAPQLGEPIHFVVDSTGAAFGPYAVRMDEEGSSTAAAIDANGQLVVVRSEAEVHPFTQEVTRTESRHEVPAPPGVTAVQLDQPGRNIFAGTRDGNVVWWPTTRGEPQPFQIGVGAGSAVTSMTMLIGDRSLVVGHADGSISIWGRPRQDDDIAALTKIRTFEHPEGPVESIVASLRDKSFLALDATNQLGLYHSTSEATLWRGPSPIPQTDGIFLSPKGNGAVVVGGKALGQLDIQNPHPEISLRALFGKVWYENYTDPEYVWQSSSGTDDFEPKLSLTPLMVGTLKGTFYSLILAIPLGVLGAMYTSQFMHPNLRRYVKPTVEIMAALPSVVLGFLAGLWLAPRVERIMPALILMAIVLPLVILATGYLWKLLPPRIQQRFLPGSEAFMYMITAAIGIIVCLWLNQSFEALVFAGDFQRWLLDSMGLPYDQRNAVVVGLAMGFAVIPIIFSIAEDAFSNVPRSLISGSLALGSTQWQTVTRVVFPTASPGIFSAIMIGFGRAIGETMIVLMATGNTPIMDWNPFNGFRTLSANIAVEIPEAPHGGTLYRTLFLAALLLFILTFVINTVAELVRQRLRRRYAEL